MSFLDPRLAATSGKVRCPSRLPPVYALQDSVPIIPISGWMGDNLIKKSDNMGWWKGKEVKTLDDRKVLVSAMVGGWS